jgi:hypothetical protein
MSDEEFIRMAEKETGPSWLGIWCLSLGCAISVRIIYWILVG